MIVAFATFTTASFDDGLGFGGGAAVDDVGADHWSLLLLFRGGRCSCGGLEEPEDEMGQRYLADAMVSVVLCGLSAVS